MMPASSLQPPAKRVFRTDINGLRAWAVIAVLFFHFKIPGFEAGFMGVDIFFVISSFLMTGIIARGLEQGNFSIWQFYMARFRRIVPAVAALIVVLLALGWFWLPTPDYKTLGAQSAYSLGFLSNIHYWRSAGYFDTAAHEKWLLHTWSLGVEMQFYILFPIFALLVWKIKSGLKVFFYSLVLIALASLALSVFSSSWKPVAAFYLLPTRGWELAAGGLVYFLGQNKSLKDYSKQLYFFGLTLWAIGFWFIDGTLPWPSAWAMLPVLGTASIILAAQNNTLLMGNAIAQWLGNISYSVYLWHWPLVVGLYFAGLQDNWTWIAGFFALSLVLGDLSYRLIETPTRKGLVKLSFAKQFAGFAAVAMVIGVCSVSVRLFTFDGRFPEAVEVAASGAFDKASEQQKCMYGTKNCTYLAKNIGVILIGDSHSQASVTALQEASKNFKLDTLNLGRNACRAIKGLRKVGEEGCSKYNNKLYDELLVQRSLKGIPVVNVMRTTTLIHGKGESFGKQTPEFYFTNIPTELNTPEFNEELRREYIKTACYVTQTNPFYLVRPFPEMDINVPNQLSRNILLRNDKSDIKITLKQYHERHAFTWSMQDEAAEKCGAKILNPLPYLCDDTYCYGSKSGRPLYYDDDHLNEYGNKFLVPMFEKIFTDLNKSNKAKKIL